MGEGWVGVVTMVSVVAIAAVVAWGIELVVIRKKGKYQSQRPTES